MHIIFLLLQYVNYKLSCGFYHKTTCNFLLSTFSLSLVWENKSKNLSLKKSTAHGSTCAIRIPVTIANWCSVPSAPRRLVGAISPTYMGVKPEANPATKQDKTAKLFKKKQKKTFFLWLDWRSGALTAVRPDDQATQHHHLKGAAQLG